MKVNLRLLIFDTIFPLFVKKVVASLSELWAHSLVRFIYDAAFRLTFKPFEVANLAHHPGMHSDFEQSSACHFIQANIGLHFPGHTFDLHTRLLHNLHILCKCRAH